MPKSVAVVFGTRPEAIKLAGVIEGLAGGAWIVHTGQHYDQSLGRDVMNALALPEPDEVLEVGGMSRGEQIGIATERLSASFVRFNPRVVVVQGDTNAALAGGLAANATEIPLVHVEAGLRSFDREMPEEHNRVLLDHLADLCCAPTSVSVDNLLAERIPSERIVRTGNTVVEAVHRLLPDSSKRSALLRRFGLHPEGYVVATFHRPENVDRPERLETILRMLAGLPLPVVLPLHPRTHARVDAFGLGGVISDLCVTAPLAPPAFLGLLADAALWISDSGGLQEEASVLKRPVIVVRRSTERPEVVGSFATLVEEIGRVPSLVDGLLDNPGRRDALRSLPSPYGEGRASEIVVAELTKRFL